MKKVLISLFVLLASGILANAQQTWFPSKVGTKLTYTSYDRKGKVTDTYTYTVTDVTKDGGKTTYFFNIETFDAKGTSTGMVVPGKMWSAEGYLHTDAKASLSGVINLNEVTIKGHAPILPENPSNGTLQDCKVIVESLMTELYWSNLKVTTGQTVTTAAGTFNDAMLLEYDSLSKVTIVKVQTRAKEWYVKGIGVVKSELYNNKGALGSYKELTAIAE